MKKVNFFLTGILTILVFSMVLVGCGGPTDINPPKVDDPDVKAQVLTTGVLLSWKPIFEAESYDIWRKGGDKPDAQIGSVGQYSAYDWNSDGVIRYTDILSAYNDLKENTEYTYTVIARAATNEFTDGKKEVKAKLGTFPPKGTKPAEPTIAYTYDTEERIIEVTVTPPTSGTIPNSYWVAVVGDWDHSYPSYLRAGTEPFTFKVDLDSYYNNSKVYYQSYVIITTGSLGSLYDDESEARDTFEPLIFGRTYNQSPLYNPTSKSWRYGTGTDSSKYVGVDLYVGANNLGLDTAATATIERAEVDKDGVVGTYAKVFDVAFDALGNPSISSAKDERPLEQKTYTYRVKAVKGATTEYFTATNDPFAVDFADDIITGIQNITVTVSSGTTYSVLPSVSSNGVVLLNAVSDFGGIAVYYVRGKSDAYQYGYQDAATVKFSKAELSATTIVAKNIVLAASATDNNYAFLQARELDKDGKPASDIGDKLTGAAINYTGNNNGQIYAVLNY